MVKAFKGSPKKDIRMDISVKILGQELRISGELDLERQIAILSVAPTDTIDPITPETKKKLGDILANQLTDYKLVICYAEPTIRY